MAEFYEEGIRFECQRCGGCCTCEGYVFIFRKDFENLLEGAKIPLEDLKNIYFSTYREYTILRDNPDGSCIFWDHDIKGCKVYEHRPTQCRTYPFWNTVLKTKKRFEDEKKDCPGIGKGRLFSPDEINKRRNTH